MQRVSISGFDTACYEGLHINQFELDACKIAFEYSKQGRTLAEQGELFSRILYQYGVPLYKHVTLAEYVLAKEV